MSHPDIPLRRIDHVRFFVGNARQSAYFYRNAFGFDVVAYAGLETGVRHEAAYVLRQGEITFVLASPLTADHPDNRRLVIHGEHKDLHVQGPEGEAGRTLREIRYGSFRRSFQLPTHVTGEAIAASYDAGVLTVRVTGAYAGTQPQRIAITM